MRKSIKKKLVALMIVGAISVPVVSFANEVRDLPVDKQVTMDKEAIKTEEIQNNYIKYEGEIQEVTDNDGKISILVTKEDDEYGLIFHISEDAALWDRETEELTEVGNLKKGAKVEAYYHKNTPMTLSLPGQLTPEVIIIQGKEFHGSTYMEEFDKELISVDNYLKLIISEETVIINEAGEQLTKEDIYNQTALVFYGASTRSIPAQTTPSKVVVFSKDEAVQETEEVEKVEAEEAEEVQESAGIEETIVMTDLRGTAQTLGYKVQWNEDKSIELTKQNQTIVIQIGKLDYTLNKSLGKFNKAPELKNNMTYVSTEIFEIMN